LLAERPSRGSEGNFSRSGGYAAVIVDAIEESHHNPAKNMLDSIVATAASSLRKEISINSGLLSQGIAVIDFITHDIFGEKVRD
jgi:hypothetical protein